MLLVEQNAMMPEIKIRLYTCISVTSRFLIDFFAVSVRLGISGMCAVYFFARNSRPSSTNW